MPVHEYIRADLAMQWVPIAEAKIDKCTRVMTFSPVYAEGDPMRYRIMDQQFLKLCGDVTHVAIIKPPRTNEP
jgi:hypothetical protein